MISPATRKGRYHRLKTGTCTTTVIIPPDTLSEAFQDWSRVFSGCQPSLTGTGVAAISGAVNFESELPDAGNRDFGLLGWHLDDHHTARFSALRGGVFLQEIATNRGCQGAQLVKGGFNFFNFFDFDIDQSNRVNFKSPCRVMNQISLVAGAVVMLRVVNYFKYRSSIVAAAYLKLTLILFL